MGALVLAFEGGDCVKEHGCAIENDVVGIVLLALLGAGFVFAAVIYVGARWKRGPYAWWVRRFRPGVEQPVEPETHDPFGRSD